MAIPHQYCLYGLVFIMLFSLTGCCGKIFRKNNTKSSVPVQTVWQVETVFSCPHEINQIRMESNHKHALIFYENPSENLISDRPGNTFELWNLELHIPYQEEPEEKSDWGTVQSAAFADAENMLYIADWRYTDRGRSLNVRTCSLNSNHSILRQNVLRKNNAGQKSLLPDTEEIQDVFIDSNAQWIAYKTANSIKPEEPAESVITGKNNKEHPLSEWKLYCCGSARTVVFPDVKLQIPSQNQETGHVTDVLAFSPDGDFVATLVTPVSETNKVNWKPEDSSTGSLSDRKVKIPRYIVIWDLKTARTIELEKAKLPLFALEISQIHILDDVNRNLCRFSPNGSMIAVRSKSHYVGIWRTINGQLLTELGKHNGEIRALDFSPNNLNLVVGTSGSESRLSLWDIRKGKLQRTFDNSDPESSGITALTYSPRGSSVYFGTTTGDVREWIIQNP
ncbi:MAG: hypothetical protein IKW74_00230 [Thermoguttaceae bacterium]|nr:hypothetical protein [Thermoguttaceae bacterium]